MPGAGEEVLRVYVHTYLCGQVEDSDEWSLGPKTLRILENIMRVELSGWGRILERHPSVSVVELEV